MVTAESLACLFAEQSRGVRILTWDDKENLVRALLILKSAREDFPAKPELLPLDDKRLQKQSVRLFSNEEGEQSFRCILVQQATASLVGRWLNGWRRLLSNPPGTLLIIRRGDLSAMFLNAPDLMSFAQAGIYDAGDVLPLMDSETLEGLPRELPSEWMRALEELPDSMPDQRKIDEWICQLRSNLD